MLVEDTAVGKESNSTAVYQPVTYSQLPKEVEWDALPSNLMNKNSARTHRVPGYWCTASPVCPVTTNVLPDFPSWQTEIPGLLLTPGLRHRSK